MPRTKKKLKIIRSLTNPQPFSEPLTTPETSGLTKKHWLAGAAVGILGLVAATIILSPDDEDIERRCVDEKGNVVADCLCDQNRMANTTGWSGTGGHAGGTGGGGYSGGGGGGYRPAFRWYYGGYGDMGGPAYGGSTMKPVSGVKIVGAGQGHSGGIVRGIFGSLGHGGGG